jgi:hypothetical protein
MQVLLSGIFGAYSDKREIEAALKEPGQSDFSHHDELWFDFIADTGDGFNPTYATARLLAEPALALPGHGSTYETKRGELLVLGGDLAYPAATAHDYHNRFVGPFSAALPAGSDGSKPLTMLSVAGNHDWYDGLTTFLRLFCTNRAIGGWQTEQTRSYFIARLPHRWWMFGIDLAFDFFIDEPQMSFFRQAATDALSPGDKVILVTHHPSWLFGTTGEERTHSPMAMSNLQQFERDVIHRNGLRLPLVLAGDIHNYNRYEREDGGTQRITSGAGGAFLYPTNHLKRELSWPDEKGRTTYFQRSVYPDRQSSRRLRWGTLLAPFKNPSFIVFIGAFDLVFALVVRYTLTQGTSLRLHELLDQSNPAKITADILDNPIGFVLVVGLAVVLIVFADAPTHPRRVLAGLIQWSLQYSLLLLVIWGMAHAVADIPIRSIHFNFYLFSFGVAVDTVVFVLAVSVVGGVLSGELFSLYLFAMFTLFGRHATHAFSSQRIEGYRNWLRLHIDGDGGLTIFPIGLKTVPKRWRVVRHPAGSPTFEPTDRPIVPHLIEEPVRIAPDGGSSRGVDVGVE